MITPSSPLCVLLVEKQIRSVNNPNELTRNNIIQANPAVLNQYHWSNGQTVLISDINQENYSLASMWSNASIQQANARLNFHCANNYCIHEKITVQTIPNTAATAIKTLQLTRIPSKSDGISDSVSDATLSRSIELFVSQSLQQQQPCLLLQDQQLIFSILQRNCTFIVNILEADIVKPRSSSSSSRPSIYYLTSHTKICFNQLKQSNPSAEQAEKNGEVEEKLTQIPAIDEPKTMDFSIIGGLDEELQSIREVIELPLFRPELFTQYGITPIHGILLFGPPGCGKTLIARTIAAQTRSHFYAVSAPEIISKYVGDSENKLRELFTVAKSNSPAIIFIDEIDSILPKREEAQDELQRRIVATVLTLMDGLDSNLHRVIVIGATNRPDSLDAAVRRPGRFDREIEIPIPNQLKRADILEKLLCGIPNQLVSSEIKQIANITHGYVGADLKALCREAAINTINRISAETNPSTAEILDLSPVLVNFADFQRALSTVRPSAMREIMIQVPNIKWSDIGGQNSVKQKLQEAVEWPLLRPEAFSRLGITPPKGILLYGPPGCSKTLMAKALATESQRNFLAVKGPELFSKYVGDSEKAVRELFRKARAAAPSIIFFDEIDSLAVNRGAGGGNDRVGERVLAQLLIELDGIVALKQVSVLAATNRPDLIDSALLRPGRIDRILYVAPPDAPSTVEILRIELKRMATSQDVSADELGKYCEGYSGAELAGLCRDAAIRAMEECINVKEIEMKHFVAAAKSVKPRITQEMLQFYKNYAEKSGLTSV
jgi:SpoVK/Ycf46/Vps4 family AAA+-type ATPase